jgi:hypothetical protein
MSGNRYLLDTNAIVALLQGNPLVAIALFVRNAGLYLQSVCPLSHPIDRILDVLKQHFVDSSHHELRSPLPMKM